MKASLVWVLDTEFRFESTGFFFLDEFLAVLLPYVFFNSSDVLLVELVEYIAFYKRFWELAFNELCGDILIRLLKSVKCLYMVWVLNFTGFDFNLWFHVIRYLRFLWWTRFFWRLHIPPPSTFILTWVYQIIPTVLHLLLHRLRHPIRGGVDKIINLLLIYILGLIRNIRRLRHLRTCLKSQLFSLSAFNLLQSFLWGNLLKTWAFQIRNKSLIIHEYEMWVLSIRVDHGALWVSLNGLYCLADLPNISWLDHSS